MASKNMIIGAGVTGISAGMTSGLPVYEANEIAGGICHSYYMTAGDSKPRFQRPSKPAYRFEIGGGHWIFGGDPLILQLFRSVMEIKSCVRKSSVYFPTKDLFVPYPIQNHLRFFGPDLANRIVDELKALANVNTPISTMEDWMAASFGPTLCDLFFRPFHQLYTAGLYKTIAPQDSYKTPLNLGLIMRGAKEDVPAVGYNSTFIYPPAGLDQLVRKMSKSCKIKFHKKIVSVDAKSKRFVFFDQSEVRYGTAVSTIPLNRMMKLCFNETKGDPSTAVLVVNLGAVRGPKCPRDQWVYIPTSKSGFHRVGFYNEVDTSFLPKNAKDRVSIYVEMAYPDGTNFNDLPVDEIQRSVVSELQEWGWIKNVDVCHSTWVDVGYTWMLPGSKWKQEALSKLEQVGIVSIGRYGRWNFQGIADSVKEGLTAGAALSWMK